jgi:hypothetical protein
LLNDQAYAAWLKDVNRRARDLTQAGAAVGAGALYYRGLPQRGEVMGEASQDGNFTPRRDQPAQYSAPVNYSPVTDSAKNILRQRVNAEILPPLSDSVSHDESRNDLVPALGRSSYMDEGRSEYDPVLGALPINAGRGAAPGMNLNDISSAISKSRAASAPARTNASASAPSAAATTVAPSSGFSLSNLLGKVYDPNYQKDMSSKQLFEAAQRDSDNPAAFFRASNRWKEENPDYKPSDSGMKRGGTAKAAGPHKDAALHKALDIIHSMLSRR